MIDEVIDRVLATGIQADARRRYVLVAWIVTSNEPDYPGRFVARMVTDRRSPFVLVGETLDDVRRQLPDGLVHSSRQPADLAEVVEIWFTE